MLGYGTQDHAWPSWPQLHATPAYLSTYTYAAGSLFVIALCFVFIRQVWSAATLKTIGKEGPSAEAFVAPCKVHHARFLPIESQHSFRYPALYFVVELDALEKRRIDSGRSFSWKGGYMSLQKRRTLCSIRPDQYLRLSYGRDTGVSAVHQPAVLSSIRLKLAYELHARGYLSSGPQNGDMGTESNGWAAEMGQVWAVTMPSLLGFQGINPLTVYYVYRADRTDKEERRRGDFWLAVLEVHNTFSERHVYILEAGVQEDEAPDSASKGNETHQWTFPRSFHVSPFNTREGYYRLNLRNLFSSAQEASGLPTIDIRLLLLVPVVDSASESPVEQPLRKKLLATLSSHAEPSDRAPTPLTSASLRRVLARQPFDLFLTSARILYEAARLHYVRRLDVFGKPDPVDVAENEGEAASFNGVGLPPPRNAIEKGPTAPKASKETGHSPHGPLLYQPPSGAELQARDRLLAFAAYRVQHVQLSLHIVSTDPAIEDITMAGPDSQRTLIVYVRSAAFFTDMFLQSTPELAFRVGSVIGRRWGVSSVEDYRAFFAGGLEMNRVTDWRTRSAQRLRERYLSWACHSGGLDPKVTSEELQASSAPHPLDVAALAPLSLAALFALHSLFWAAWLERAVFGLVGARYARGTEPWLEVYRAVRALRAERSGGVEGHEEEEQPWTRLGSVRSE